MLLAALLLLLLPRCLRGHGGGVPAPPANAGFQEARLFQHVLSWEPPGTGPRPAGRLLYDVQYRRYGNSSWTPAPNCTRIARRSCDLSYETRDPSWRYLARVRAVASGRTSSWTQPIVFVLKEATLYLSNMSLSLKGGTIQVSLQLPISPWDNITYEDIHTGHREYHAHIRRVSNNAQAVHVATGLKFDLPSLLPGECYCISVEPHVASQPNPTTRTEEQCILTPPLEDCAGATLATPSLSLLSLAVLGVLGLGLVLRLACAYVKKPTETPNVLQSLLNGRSPWLPKERSPHGMKDVVLHVEADTIQQLSFVGLKDHSRSSTGSHSPGAAPQPPCLEQSGWLPAWLAEGTRLEGLMDVSSSCSTDSGICLQEPLGSLSHLLGCRRLSLGSSEDGGLQEDGCMEDQWLQGASEAEGVLQPQTQFSGYQKQLGGSVEVVSSPRPPAGMAHSELGLVTGYLKQASLGAPSALGDRAPAEDTPGSTDLGKGHFPASLSLDVSGTLEIPKSLLALGFSEQEPAGTSLHIASLLHTGTQLSLDLSILTLPRR
ncbi:interleukin-10 receptor subunit alpha [Elgaria multicarinata webbii]|uniref:interleukin-10 receptor subunit alpha n=1 Tax=Elgaria multicarinata webbii TaxID=159646 RepID=UPI002FCCD52C